MEGEGREGGMGKGEMREERDRRGKEEREGGRERGHLRHGTTQQSVVGGDGQFSVSKEIPIHRPQLDFIAST